MKKSYGIEVMKMLKFPPHVVEMAEDYLRFYENTEEEEQVGNLPKEVKEDLVRLMADMENDLSQSQPEAHREVRDGYKSKVRKLLGKE